MDSNLTKRSYLEDNIGDKSSKRLAAMIFLIASLIIGGFIVIAGTFYEIKSPELVKFVFGGMISGCLLSLGFTIPELFSDLVKK